MKKIILFLICLVGFNANAQELQLSAYSGWQTPSSLELYFGRYRTEGNMNYGGILSFGKGENWLHVARNSWIELQYNYKKAALFYFDDLNDRQRYFLGSLSTHNIFVSGIKESNLEVVKPFGGFGVGAAILAPENFSSEVKFMAAVTGGLKIEATPVFGVRPQAQLLMPFYFSDVVVGWSPGSGVSTGLSSSTVILSAAFTGGIYFNLSALSRNSAADPGAINP